MAKYQKYAEYKDSGVEWLGEIPSHWEKILFKRVVLQVKDGTHGTHQRVEEGSYLLSAKNVFNHGIEIGLTESRIPNKDYQEIVSNGFPKKGDILVTCVGTIGRSCVYTFEKPIAFQRSVAFLRLNSQCDSKYYKYFIESKQYQSQLESLIKSSAQGGVYMGDLINTVVANCDFLEQKQISNFLDHETAKIDQLIEKQQQLIELLKEKRQAVISHAVTKGLNPNVPMKDSGVAWLGEVPEHWEVTRFAYQIFYQEGPGILAVDFHETGIPLLRIQNVKSDFVSNDYKTYLLPSKVLSKWDHYRVEKGDLIISCSASTGLVSEVDESTVGAIPYTGLIRLKPRTRKIISQYIKLLVQSDLFFEQIEVLQTGSTIQHFGPFHLQQMYISLPPNEEQEVICLEVKNRVRDIENLILKAESAIQLMQERRIALISAAVTGKIDVRNWQAPTLAEAQTELSA